MKILDLTFPTPSENLACDKDLLDQCEKGQANETLRFWESSEYFVVLGYSNLAEKEVNLDYCRENQIPVLRRVSGGGTVLQGPGCLNYSLILKIRNHPALSGIISTNQFILKRNCAALAGVLSKKITIQGQTDLTVGNLKFSGNAQRRKRNAILFHGTFLLNFDLSMIGYALQMPSRQPSYREHRTHGAFLTNLNVEPSLIKCSLQKKWDA